MFDLDNLTPTQKLELISSRIFGHNIGKVELISCSIWQEVMPSPAPRCWEDSWKDLIDMPGKMIRQKET